MQTRSRTKSLQQDAATTGQAQSQSQQQSQQQQAPAAKGQDDMKSLTDLALNSTVRLASGALMPRLGFGVYQARGDECRAAVKTAIEDGYRHIDSAQAYHNEHHVAAGIAATSVHRKDLFLTTKFMPGHSVPTEDEVFVQLQKSLATLVPESPHDQSIKAYIDLFLIHAPRPNEKARAVHWAALARAQKEGWVRDIGVSNFSVKHLEALPGPIPAVNQIELHPFCQQRDIVDYCRKKGIVVQAYCPIVRAQADKINNPVLADIAHKHGKEVTQVLIRWSLQKGFVPLPKSVTPARIKANAEVYDFVLDDEDMQRIDALDEGAKGAVSWNPVDHV